MKKFLFILLTCLSSISWGQYSVVWANPLNGTSLDQGKAVAVGPSGSIYFAGDYMRELDALSGPTELWLNSNEGHHGFLLKTDSAGNLKWVKSFPGVFVTSMTIDSQENIYVTGTFYGFLNFGDSSTPLWLGCNYGLSQYILRFNSSGQMEWAKNLIAPGKTLGARVEASAIAVDKEGSIYFTGFYKDTIDFDPGSTVSLLHTNEEHSFLLKLKPGGVFSWVVDFGPGRGNGLTIDSLGNVYVTGVFNDTCDFDPQTTNHIEYSSNGNAFFVKITKDKNLVWAKRLNSPDISSGTAIVTDKSNNVTITGIFKDRVVFNNQKETLQYAKGGTDIFILQVDSLGEVIWFHSFGSEGEEQSYAIHADMNSNVFIGGSLSNTLYTGKDKSIFVMNPPTMSMDAYILMLDKEGTLRHSISFGGPGICGDLVYSIGKCEDHELIVGGTYGSDFDADPGNPAFSFNSEGADPYFFRIRLDLPLGNNKTEMDSEVKIFPNPATGSIRVITDENVERLMVIETTGRVILEKRSSSDIDISLLPQGIYLLYIDNGRTYKMKKFIKN